MLDKIKESVEYVIRRLTTDIATSLVRRGEWRSDDYQMQLNLEGRVGEIITLVKELVQEYKKYAEDKEARVLELISNLYPELHINDPRFTIQAIKRQVAKEIMAEITKGKF